MQLAREQGTHSARLGSRRTAQLLTSGKTRARVYNQQRRALHCALQLRPCHRSVERTQVAKNLSRLDAAAACGHQPRGGLQVSTTLF